MKKLILISSILLFCCSLHIKGYAQNSFSHEDSVSYNQFIAKFHNPKSPRDTLYRSLDLNQEQFVKIAETILYKVYGKRKIKGERPYSIAEYAGYWFMGGTMHCKECFGGVFDIVINSRNGKVEYMEHGK